MRLVLADEQRMFADSLADELEKAGHRVEATASASGSLVAAVRMAQPDASVFDISYGGHVHHELPATVRQAAPGARLVVLTGHQDDELWEAYRTGTIDALIGKGCGLAAVDDTLQRVARGERPVVCWTRTARRRHSRGTVLTPRESDVVRMLAQGSSTDEISTIMRISPNTLRTHVQHLMDKLGAHSRLQVVQVALEQSLVDLSVGA